MRVWVTVRGKWEWENLLHRTFLATHYHPNITLRYIYTKPKINVNNLCYHLACQRLIARGVTLTLRVYRYSLCHGVTEIYIFNHEHRTLVTTRDINKLVECWLCAFQGERLNKFAYCGLVKVKEVNILLWLEAFFILNVIFTCITQRFQLKILRGIADALWYVVPHRCV